MMRWLLCRGWNTKPLSNIDGSEWSGLSAIIRGRGFESLSPLKKPFLRIDDTEVHVTAATEVI